MLFSKPFLSLSLLLSVVLFNAFSFAQSENSQVSSNISIDARDLTSQSANLQASQDLAELEDFIDGYVTSMISDFDPPGMTVAVVLGNEQLTKGYGIANVETLAANNEKSLFRIGSISKLFVWLSAHMLAEQGKLDLDADINTYLDGFSIPATFEKSITMRDLMAHRPGFDDNLRDFLDPDRDVDLAQAVARNIPLRVAPAGERTSYSNTGTNIAAYIVQVVSGMDYFDFVQQNILQPVGLNSTTLRDPNTGKNEQQLEARMAQPHDLEKGIAKKVDFMAVRPQEAVGAVAMDAVDAAKFMRLLLNQTQYDGGQLLSAKAWSRITQPAFADAVGSDDMGWGFMLNDIDGYATVGHGGATKFLSIMYVLPDLNMGVFVSSNMTSKDAMPLGIAAEIVRRVTGKGSLQDFLALPGNVDEAKAVAGYYINNRRPQDRGVAIFAAGTDKHITATDDGYLIMPGDPETRYASLGNGVWVDKGGMRLRVVKDDSGKVIRLHGGKGSATLEKVSFMSTKNALIIGFGGVLLLSITSLLGMYYRHGRELPVTPLGNKLGWVTVSSVVVWFSFFIFLAAGMIAIASMEISEVDKTGFPSTAINVAFFLSAVLCVHSLIKIAAVLPVWRASGWGVWRKIHFTLYALLTLFAVVLMLHWNIVAGSIYGL